MSTSTSEAITKVTCIAAIGLGVFGAIAPRAFARSYRFDDTNASLVHLTRLLNTRNATLGALGMLTNSSADRRTFLTAGLALNTVDALSGLTASKSIPTPTRMLATATSAAIALAFGSALATTDD